MARTKAFDTTAVLHRAMKAFGVHGYEGATLPDLLKELGIARQSLYDTYGTKRELFIAAVKLYMDGKANMLEAMLTEQGAILPLLEQVFATMVDTLLHPELSSECFIIASAVEEAGRDAELQDYVQQNQQRIEQVFQSLLERAIQQQELAADEDVTALAQFLAHERLALVFSARAGMDEARLRTVTRLVLSLVSRHMIDPSGA
ncbi:TetR/AcrR family transcriptional regulator [Paenibacillus hunanensis]|uniref:TetR/AcrR family transcriptional regulator n=1 Tax=Paenibacillus hunanensis TaxID=539262 RepID=UPI002A69C097|nr:TetR/AcrR family transcriptional regulator [Paenibacillus hunanensis]WPP41195.1 TetR/AcrR family transcriptional regulator [Paenibacillus hunanensis]